MWGATERYYASHTKTMLPTKTSVRRSRCNRTTGRPLDHRKEMQTAVIWSCVLFKGLAKIILQGTVKGRRRQGRQRKRWEDNIREWTGLEFDKSVVRKRPSRLRDRWWNDTKSESIFIHLFITVIFLSGHRNWKETKDIQSFFLSEEKTKGRQLFLAWLLVAIVVFVFA